MPYIGNQPYQGVIDSGNILNGSIDTVDLKDGSVTSAKLETIGGLTAGSYTTANITVDSKGRVTLASNGSGGVSSITGTADQITASASTGAITLSLPQSINTTSSPSFANITLTGEIRGPSTLIIDPTTVGDDTGIVRIRGDLQVDGTTTTINSTTLEVADLNITLAKNAANAAAATGAGITVAGANATLTYAAATDTWNVNKNILITPGTGNGILYLNANKVATTGSALTFDGTNLSTSGYYIGTAATGRLAKSNTTGRNVFTGGTTGGTTDGAYIITEGYDYGGTAAGGAINLVTAGASSPITFLINGSEAMRLNSTGLGIGTNSPGAKLTVDITRTTSGAYDGILVTGTQTNNIGGGNNYALTVAAAFANSSAPDRLAQIYVKNPSLSGAAVAHSVRGISIDKISGGNQGSAQIYLANNTSGGAFNSISGQYALYSDNTANSYIAGNLGIGTTSPGYKLDVNGTAHVSSYAYLDNLFSGYIPHTGVIGFGATVGGAQTVTKLKWGSYGRIQHTSFTNTPFISFNAELYESDFAGSGSGQSDRNYFRPDYALGNYGIISSINGGVGFNVGVWSSATSINIGDFLNHNSFAGGVVANGNWEFKKNLAIGGASATTSGTGITFPATQVASSDANTLDDYEEGICSMSVSPGTGAFVSSSVSGMYTKVGRLVVVQGRILVSDNGTGGSYGILSGLPFVVATSSSGINQGCGTGRMGGTTGYTCNFNLTQGGTSSQIWYYNNAYPFSNGSDLVFTISYMTN